MAWRDDIEGQVINTDIDGLLTAALLWEKKGWPLWGFCDTESVWVTDEAVVALRDRPETVAWVDIDMCWPRTRSISQHVIIERQSDLAVIDAFATTSNPNLQATPVRSRTADYRWKYPYGTFQWVWWLAGLPPPDLDDRVATGLVWMPDGGFGSILPGRHPENCREWATNHLPESPMSPLIVARREREATRLVSEAEHWLTTRSPASAGRWFNHQYKMSRIVGGVADVRVDPSTPEGRNELNSLLAAIAQAFGWGPPLRLDGSCHRFMGTWESIRTVPPGWPGSANSGDLVSVAVGFGSEWFFTRPTNDRGEPPLTSLLPSVHGPPHP